MSGKTYVPPFKKMRFIVESPEHSKLIQEALFKLGYKWPVEGTTLAHFDKPYLFGDDDGDLLYSTSHHLSLAYYWGNGTLETLQIMIKEMEKLHMTTLKTNWAIRTTDEQFKAYIGTLEALGYNILASTRRDTDKPHPMSDMHHYTHIVELGDEVVSRRHQYGEITNEKQFSDISSFLVYHFISEKTGAEKELEALQEKMNSLQEQIDRVKLSITK